MEEKQQIQANKNNGSGCAIVLFIVFLLIFAPMLIGLISNNIETSNQAKHEAKLIEYGKTKTHNQVIDEIVEMLKNKDAGKLKEYLADDFIYYDNDNIEHKYISSFFEDLKIHTTSYEIERRGDISANDWATYRIYWNIVEENKEEVIEEKPKKTRKKKEEIEE